MGLSKQTQQKLFTIGYVAKGIVYVLIGFFAIASLVGLSFGTSGPKGVIEWIGTNPFGKILLALIGLGLLSYCVWRWYRAVQNTSNEDDDAKGYTKRVVWAISGTSYGALAVFAFREAFRGGGNSGQKQDMVATLLQQPWGQWLVGILGVIFTVVGLYQIYRAVTDEHMKRVQSQQMSEEREEAFRTTGRIGLSARAIVYGVISYFLFRAAFMNDPSQFKGIGESLQYLESGWGTSVLIAVGLGLLAYGLFMFVRARFEKV